MMCLIKKSTVLAVAAAGLVFAQGPAPRWQNLYPEYNGLAFGGDKFVAVSGDGLIRTTSDGAAWSQYFFNDAGSLLAAAYGGGRFILMQRGSSYMYSFDGAAWGSATTGIAPSPWKSAVFGDVGGGSFVAVDENGMTALFDDTDGWMGNIDAGIDLSHVAFGEGVNRFVAVGDGIRYSRDGRGWQNTNLSSAPASVAAFGKEKFVALSRSGGSVYTSADGASWATASAPGVPAGMADMVFGKGVFVAVGAKGAGCVSSDGTAWTSFTLNEADDFKAVKYGKDIFLALGAKGSVYKSADGSKWDRLAGNSVASYKQIVHDGAKTFAAVGDSGVWVSEDGGKDWQRKSGVKNLKGVAFGANIFVAVGDGGAIISSEDKGKTWTDRNVGDDVPFTSVAFGNGVFIAGGRTSGPEQLSRAVVYTSRDGQAWADLSSELTGWGNGQYPVSLGFGNDKFFAAVSTTKEMKVCNAAGVNVGQYWDPVSTLPEQADGYRLASIVYAENRFVSLGTKTTGEAVLLNSVDGVNWTAITIPPETVKWVRSATYAKGANFIVADSGGVYAHVNGAWVRQGKATGRNLSTIYSGDNAVIVAGALGAMLYSTEQPTSVRHAAAPRSAASSKGGLMSLERVRRAPSVTLSFTPNSAGTLAVYSLRGKLLYKARLGAGERSVLLPERAMSSGSVIVRYSGGGRVVSQRFQFVR